MLKIAKIYITIVSYFFLCGGENCENQLSCLLQDPLGGLLHSLTTNCITNSSGVQYWLYTPNSTVQLQPDDLIDSNKPVNVLIHGWGGNRSVSYIQVIKNAYLQRYGWEHTIILVDYGMYARSESGNILSLYSNAYCNLPPISANVASFLCRLCTSNGVKPDDIHLIGHSLGAHVSGIAGWYFQQNCNATIGRITGLDPASPGFICPLCNNFRLDWNDAKFVDIIHTDVFLYGTPLKSGDIDFFVNHGGPFQPGCFGYPNETVVSLLEDPLLILLMPVSCSHQRSCYFFAESIILNDFLATSCTLAGNTPLKCLYVDKVYMGEYCKKRQAYDFYGASAKAEFPYGYGPRGPLH